MDDEFWNSVKADIEQLQKEVYYDFDPKKDITTLELANLLAIILRVSATEKLWKNGLGTLRRHFKKRKIA